MAVKGYTSSELGEDSVWDCGVKLLVVPFTGMGVNDWVGLLEGPFADNIDIGALAVVRGLMLTGDTGAAAEADDPRC